MTTAESQRTRRQQVLAITGMAMVWPSIHNQLLYPVTFSFHKQGAAEPYGPYLLYSAIMLVAVLALVAMGRRGLARRLFSSSVAMASFGILGACGIGLLVACNFDYSFGRWFMGAGVALAAVYVPASFMFWSIQLAYASHKRAAFDLILSYLVFCAITALRLGLGVHAWLLSILYPLVSAALALAVLRKPSAGKYALGTTPLKGLPLRLLVPTLAFVYLGAVSRCLLNPLTATFDYPPPSRAAMYVALAALCAAMALMYRPGSRMRRSANLLTFLLVAVFTIGAILLTGVGLAGDVSMGNLPSIAGINAAELFIWVLVLINAQSRHAGILKPAAVYLVFVIGATHLISVLVLGGIDRLEIDTGQLPLISITIGLAFLVVAVVMAVMAIMLYNMRAQVIDGPLNPTAAAVEAPVATEGPVQSRTKAETEALSASTSDNPSMAQEASAASCKAMPPCLTLASDEAAITRIQETFGLSRRETDTLRLASRSKSAKEIAASLFVAESTVNSHIKSIYRKCDVHSRQELVALVNRFKAGKV